MSENRPSSNKAVPSSPLGKEDPPSSPGFRPAGDQNLTIDLKKGVQAGGRKSLGRRVSFARTAHVRLYEKGDSDKEEASGDEGGGEDFTAPKKSSFKGSPMPPPSHHSPAHASSRLSESHSRMDIDDGSSEGSMPSTPSSKAFTSGRPSILQLSPIAPTLLANAPSSPASVGSFDVDLKDANSSSFTSYVSPGEDDDHTIELRGHVGAPDAAGDDTDMDFTSCVGGILQSTAIVPKSSNKEELRDENNTMDFTTCVGGIIRNMRLSDISQVSSVDTMELTECVGKIIARQQGLLDTDKDVVMQDASEQVDMDMTMVVTKTIHHQQEYESPGSPSPFLVSTPKNTPQHASVATMTFIGDIDQPDAFSMLSCESPMPATVAQAKEEEKAAPQLIQETAPSAPIKPLSNTAIQSLMNSVSVLGTPTRPANCAWANSTASVSLQSSLSSLSPAPSGPSLSEFLNSTGIRFLENISSLKRRETTGRPRDSDVVAPSKQAFIAAALLPQADFYDKAAEELVPMIMSAREALSAQEAQFCVQPPLAFLQHERGDASTRQNVLTKLKTLKSVARLMAKHEWHQWRLVRQEKLNTQLDENLSTLKAAWDPLHNAGVALDALIGEHLEPTYRARHTELQSLEMQQSRPDEAEQARRLEALVVEQTASLDGMKAELDELERQEAALQKAISEAAEQKKRLSARIEASRQTLSTTPKSTELLLNEMRSLLALRKAVTGWELVNIQPSSLVIRYLLGGPVMIKFEFDPSTRLVHHAAMNGSQARLQILKSVDRLKIPLGAPLVECLRSVLSALDSLVAIERQIDPSTCTFEHEDCEEDTNIGFKLCFFSYESRSKFDIHMSIPDGSRLAFSRFTHHYGPITLEDVHDYIGLALSTAGGSLDRAAAACKQIITSVHGLISEHTVDGRPSDAFSLCFNPATD